MSVSEGMIEFECFMVFSACRVRSFPRLVSLLTSPYLTLHHLHALLLILINSFTDTRHFNWRKGETHIRTKKEEPGA